MPFNYFVRRHHYRHRAEVEAARESALQAVMHLLQPVPHLQLEHRRELLTISLWKWTEASGIAPHAKYNLQYATPAALNHDSPVKINHEHVWTRRWIIDRLLQRQQSWSKESLRAFLQEYGVACIVSVEEHARLGSVTGEGWQRYSRAGVVVWDLAQSGPLALPPHSLQSTTSATFIDDERALDTGLDDESSMQEEAAESDSERDADDEILSDAQQQSLTSGNSSVDAAFDERSGIRADLMKRLAASARRSDGVCLVGETREGSGTVGKYVRLHDTIVSQPTRAAAFLHWKGRVSLALLSDDLPPFLLNQPSVAIRAHPTYGIRCKVNDETSLKVAEQLAWLALEKIREAYADGDL